MATVMSRSAAIAVSRCLTRAALSSPEKDQGAGWVRLTAMDGQSSRPGSISRHATRFAMGRLHHARPQQYFYAADDFPGRVYKSSLDGTVLGILGAPAGS